MTTESFRKDIARKLSALQNEPDEDASVAFPTDLTSSDRKYVHKIAESFKLHTQSTGVGAARFMTVYKNVPEGQEAKIDRGAKSFIPKMELTAASSGLLREIAGSVQEGDGRPVLANVRASSRMKSGKTPQTRHINCPVEAFWPDDEEWKAATLSKTYPDCSYQVIWDEDGTGSDVPKEYVRLPGGGLIGMPEMSIEGMEEVVAERRQNPAYAKLGDKREALPGFVQRADIVKAMSGSQVCLLRGETGCGKSTQVPQLILDSCPEAKVLCMQPRKLAATTLAERIAAERCQTLGQDVGYHVPFGAKGVNSRLVFATLGVFRSRMLQDTELRGITHVVFDEVHERDKLADFNMIFVRDLLERRNDLRVMLMSATLQMETFERYFPGSANIEIPGRVFPVSELYMDEVAATLYKQPIFRTWLGPGILCGGIDIPAGAEGDWNERAWKTVVFKHTKPEDRESLWGLKERGMEEEMMAPFSKWRLTDGLRKHDVLQQSSLAFDYPIIEALVLHIDRMYKAQQKQNPEAEVKPPGTVLVFLPGWGDIDFLNKKFTQSFDQKRFMVLPLHSQVSPDEQQKIFQPAPEGMRKIVLTTNIAEASITVEGTEFVIDCGRAKEVSYDPYLKVGTLTTSWISQASAKQRAGRAGRTQGGLCFHLFCRERLGKIDEFLQPELLRSPLEDSALTGKLQLMQMGSTEKVSHFLAKAPDPPEQMAIDNSIQLLVELGALTADESLTALGEHLTRSPLPPRLAKTVLWSILFGCLDDALCVVAAGGGFVREPFRMSGLDREAAQNVKRDLAKPYNSDHACLMKAVSGYTDASNQEAFCQKWHLAPSAMRQIRDQQNRLFTELKENKTESFANRNRGNYELLVAVLCAGIFPNVARRRGSSDFYEAQGGKVEARPHGMSAYLPNAPDEWVFYQELGQMESTYKMKLVSPIGPLPMLLLGGEGPALVEAKGGGKGGSTISLLDGFVKFSTTPDAANQVRKLRSALQAAFQAFCQRPGDIPSAQTLAMLDSVVSLIGDEDTAAPQQGVKRQLVPPGGDAQRNVKGKFGGGGKGGMPGKGFQQNFGGQQQNFGGQQRFPAAPWAGKGGGKGMPCGKGYGKFSKGY